MKRQETGKKTGEKAGEETETTCGRGLAQHAAIPAKMGSLLYALAETLELHRATLQLEDPKAGKEDDAYRDLASSYRQIAALVQKTAAQMEGYRDLPMAAHDEKAFGPAHVEAFRKFVKAQSELLATLRTAADGDEKMLAQMSSR
jgi:hypothetical protein